MVLFNPAAIVVVFCSSIVGSLFALKMLFFFISPVDAADGNINVPAVQQLDHIEYVVAGLESVLDAGKFHTFTLRCCAHLSQNSLSRCATTGMDSALDLDIRADHMI